MAPCREKATQEAPQKSGRAAFSEQAAPPQVQACCPVLGRRRVLQLFDVQACGAAPPQANASSCPQSTHCVWRICGAGRQLPLQAAPHHCHGRQAPWQALALRMAAVSSISAMKVERPRIWQSPAPTRAYSASRTEMRASEAGTKLRGGEQQGVGWD